VKQNTVTALLAVIAVLLGLNLIVKESPAAVGQAAAIQVEPTVVAGAVSFPDIATGANTPKTSEVALVLRFWSDGAVDSTRVLSELAYDACSGAVPTLCDGPTTLIPGTCQSDITRDGEADVQDFLWLIGEWGPCAAE